jgi:hypothetical protein
VKITKLGRTGPALAALSMLLGACGIQTKTTVTHELSADADAPYEKILVVTLFDSFDARRFLEKEIVSHLAELGTVGVASTSMMNTKTPVVAATFIKMVDDIGADALLLTQQTSHFASHSERDSSPQATYNYWPTHYYNVFQVELTEYVEPTRLEIEHDLLLASQVFSVKTREPVWGMESESVFTEKQEDGLDYNIFVNEANAIVSNMSRDQLIAR